MAQKTAHMVCVSYPLVFDETCWTDDYLLNLSITGGAGDIICQALRTHLDYR